jgi:KaiC/GvpD/RAD55 family RecA-like ATPase
MTVPEQIASALREVSDSAAVSLITDISNYFTAMKEVVRYTEEEGISCVYITSTIPSSVIEEQLTSEGLGADHVFFVDCISYMVGKAPGDSDKVLYIESPTMVETIMLRIQESLKRLGDKPKLVFLDSVNTMALHNDEKVVQEFVHYLINSLRVREIPSVALSIVDQTPEDLEIILKLVCDEVVEAIGDDDEF